MIGVRVATPIVFMCIALAFSASIAHASPQTIRGWAATFYRPYFRNHPPDLYSTNFAPFFTRRFSSVYFAAARCGLLADDPFIGGAQPTRLTRLDIVAVQSDGLNANVTLGLNSAEGDQWQMHFRLVNSEHGWLIDNVKLLDETDWWSAAIQPLIVEERRDHRC
jgi:hypothetical protein